MNTFHRFGDRITCGLILSFVFSIAPVAALAETKTQVQDIGGGEKRVTLTQAVEPSFHIEPIVHRFEARRGATIPFRFEIKSTGKAMDVEVIPVRLRQEISGIIMHDVEGEPPEEMRFLTPTRFKLAPGESINLDGEVTVPLAKSNFLSYGVLVRDNGQSSGPTVDPDNPNKITAGVRFVTQYVLRVDIETGVKDLSQMNHLAFEQGQVVKERGMPVAKTFLVNPTDFAFECSVRGTIESATMSQPKPFRMYLPSRVNLENDERYLVRVMPHSRVLVSAPVDSLLFPGEQTLRLEVTNGRRGLVDQNFSMNVGPGDFPALEVSLAYIDHELSVNPAQVEVGNIAGANRSVNMRFTNNSTGKKTVVARLLDMNGNSIDDLRLSSGKFDVKPGRTKTIRASAPSKTGEAVAKYGMVELKVTNEDGSSSAGTLPLAMMFGQPPTPSVSVGELESVEKNGVTSFRLKVTNNGQGYVPVHGDLQVADGSGHALELADGFGRWLKPGETRELAFVPQRTLAAGKYQVSLQLQTTPDQEPVTQTLVIELAPEIL